MSDARAVVFAFDLEALALSDEQLRLPAGLRLDTVAAVPADDRRATHRLESLWAMERGWIRQPHPWIDDLSLHLVEDYPSTDKGFTLLARDEVGQVVGMHGAHLDDEGNGRTDYLVVEPALRGRGLGRALKAWQLQTAKQLGWTLLLCDAPGDAAAAGVRALNAALGGRLLSTP